MSRIPKWKIEKSKVKVVFRLQFQATHIPQPGWDKLFVSFISTDSGKVTAKTSKASVRNGSCKWSDPIYETTRLLQDPKTKDYEEKLYKLVVAMGSSRSSLLGEVIINLTDFIDALKPSSAALPLHGCEFGTILHITVQLLTSKTGFREFEQQRELSVRGFQASSGKKIHEQNEDSPATSGSSEHIDKVNARVRFKGDSTVFPSLEVVGELDEEYEDLAAVVDGSSYTSESLYAEKNNFSGSTDLDGLEGRVAGDEIGFTPVQSSITEKGDHNCRHLSSQLSNDWGHGWSSDYSIDNDLASTCEDNDRLTARLQVTESSVLQLKAEAKSLQNISAELSSETQNLAQQISVELASGEKMAREVDILKSECWKFKNELDELKSASTSLHISRRKTPSSLQMKHFPADTYIENMLVDSEFDAGNSNLPCDYQSKLLQGIFLIECKAQQIQNKPWFGYNGNGFENIYSDFNILGSLIQNLKQTIAHGLFPEAVSAIQKTKNQCSLVSLSEEPVQALEAGRRFAELCYAEGIKEENMYELLEQFKLSKTEDESLAKRMTKVESYYEELIKELEGRQKQTSDQLENLRAEHSSCFYTISALQNQTEKLHEELNGQLVRFAEDRHNLESFIKELEKRAISSETMLKRVRCNYAVAVDRLQKDLELLSFQVLSMYEANESLAMQALSDATEQHSGEHPVEMELCQRGESFVSSNQKQQKQAPSEIQHDIDNHDLSATVNGISDKFNYKMLYNLSSKAENKGPTVTGLSMGLEFHVNEELNAPVNTLKVYDIKKDTLFSHDSLMEKQRTGCILHNVQIPIDHSQISNNLKNVKDIYHYPPPEYCQIANNTENMKTAHHFSLPENQLLDYIVRSKEKEISVDVVKQLHASSEAELSEVLMLNLQLEIHAQVVQETLRDVFSEIGHLKGKVIELQKKMKQCTNDKEFLVLKLHTALNDSRTLREVESNCISRYNEMVFTCHINEEKLNEALDEKNVLALEIAGCRSLIENSRVYESKYKICIEEKNDLENKLIEEQSQRECLQSKISSLINELKSLKQQYEKKCYLNSDLEKDATDLHGKLSDLCNWIKLHNQWVDSIIGDISVKEELDCENYDAIFTHLEQFQQKVSCWLLRLQHEKKVAEEQMEVSQCELNERKSDILYMTKNFEFELEGVRTKLEFSSNEIERLQIELYDALEKLKLSREAEEWHKLENTKLLSIMSILEVELQQVTDECKHFCQFIFETDHVMDEFANTELGLIDLQQENRDLFSSIQSGNETPVKMECESPSLKNIMNNAQAKLLRLQQGKKVAEEQREIAQCLYNEKESHILLIRQKFESELEEVRTKLELSRTNVQQLHTELQGALETLKNSKESEEWHILENRKLLSNISILEVELQQATDECRDFSKKLHFAEGVNEELTNTKLRLTYLIQENKDLLFSIQSSNEASVKMRFELSSLKDSLHYAHDELHSERKNREELEVFVTELKLQVLETSQQLLAFNELNAEFCYLKVRVLELEKEVTNMENQLVAAFGHSISADVELAFLKNQFSSKMAEFDVHQKTTKTLLDELHLKDFAFGVSLDKYIVSEANLMAEIERLSTDLLSAKSTLEVLLVEKETLLICMNVNTVNPVENENLKGKAAIFESNYAKGKQHYENEICVLKSMLLRLEELDELWLTKVELDIMVVCLSSKFNELETHAALFEECEYEMRNLREQHIDLNQKLSEQILKTEEFKNLSIHLREFKEKADAEYHQDHERRESEGSSFAVQESLRIAFIKEQYESKIQELRSQCTVSKKYAEEMLMKLQSSLNDNETRKRSEAHLSKRNEEISVLLSGLDTELQTVLTDKRELIKAYDRMKAELECTILSLECCKEEKQKLQNSLKESSEEREKIRVELDLVKRLLENMASITGTGVRRNYESDNTYVRLIGELLEDDPHGIPFMNDKASSALGICSKDKVIEAGQEIASARVKSSSCREAGDIQLTGINGNSFKSSGKAEAAVERATLLEHNATRIADIKEHFREQQRLINGMELLHKQLQRLKIENSSEYQLQEDRFDADLQRLHTELSQLDMVNEQLASIFPTYKDLNSYGNALERVLSLELELAEALQVKKKPGSYIQSSFLKQHEDDEAVFQSFKDINELIKDMIELKKRNVTIETELQEMHGRYSQLSLQFAEVEGERQKLVMSLKNRTPKKS